MDAVLNELENTYHYTPEQIDNGGLRIVTTFSKPMMNQLYATVAQQERQMRLDRRGAAQLRAHRRGAGAARAPARSGPCTAGPNYERQELHEIRCQWDMALQNREQVGSSFKPYVLALARSAGHEREDQHAGRPLTAVDPAGRPSPMTYASQAQPANPGELVRGGQRRG